MYITFKAGYVIVAMVSTSANRVFHGPEPAAYTGTPF